MAFVAFSVMTGIGKLAPGERRREVYFLNGLNLNKPGEYTVEAAIQGDVMRPESMARPLAKGTFRVTVLPRNEASRARNFAKWEARLQSPDPQVRLGAVVGLMYFEDPSTLPLVRLALRTSSPHAPWLIGLLAQFGTPEALELARSAATTPGVDLDLVLSELVQRNLAISTDDFKIISKGDNLEKEMAIYYFSKLPRSEYLPSLMVLRDDSDPRVRTAAANALKASSPD